MAETSLTFEQMLTTKYSRKLRASLQQKASELRNRVTVHTDLRDELFQIPKIGKRSLQLSTNGKGDTPDVDNTFEKSWMGPEWWHDGYIHNRQFHQQSQYADQIITQTQENQLNACNRKIDEIIVQAILGEATRGVSTNLTKVALPESQIIGVAETWDGTGTANGLSLDKLRIARKKLVDADAIRVDDKVILICGMHQLMELLADERATSADYVAMQGLISGTIKEFMGFTFIVSPHLPHADGVRKCVAYLPSAVDFGIWEESRTEVTNRADKMNCPQIYTTIGLGGVRSEDLGVVEIDCAEA